MNQKKRYTLIKENDYGQKNFVGETPRWIDAVWRSCDCKILSITSVEKEENIAALVDRLQKREREESQKEIFSRLNDPSLKKACALYRLAANYDLQFRRDKTEIFSQDFQFRSQQNLLLLHGTLGYHNPEISSLIKACNAWNSPPKWLHLMTRGSLYKF